MTTPSHPIVFEDLALDPPVRGFLHTPAEPNRDGLVLTHGAGGNANAPLLVSLAETFCSAGVTVLRCNMPFRQNRSFGPPRPGDAARDREGLKRAVSVLQPRAAGRVFLGGQSYGGRQASMLCADESDIAVGLLLLSYPLHPPGKPAQLRTQHLPKLKIPVLLIQGTHDPFGSIEELERARKLIPSKTRLVPVEGVGHDLGFGRKKRVSAELPAKIWQEFGGFFG